MLSLTTDNHLNSLQSKTKDTCLYKININSSLFCKIIKWKKKTSTNCTEITRHSYGKGVKALSHTSNSAQIILKLILDINTKYFTTKLLERSRKNLHNFEVNKNLVERSLKALTLKRKITNFVLST